MANAFIVDYIADTMRANGFVRGSVSSYDGFVRNLDDLSGSEYAFNIFNRVGNTVHQAGVMRYDHAMSIVFCGIIRQTVLTGSTIMSFKMEWFGQHILMWQMDFAKALSTILSRMRQTRAVRKY